MSYTTYFKKMALLVELIEQEKTGCANCLAEKLQVSRRTVFRYLDELRMKEANIYYSRSKETYCFKNNFCFTKDFI